MAEKNLTFDGRLACFRHPDVSKARIEGIDELVCVVCEAQWAVWAHAEIARLHEAGDDLVDSILTIAPSTMYPKIVQDALNAWITARRADRSSPIPPELA